MSWENYEQWLRVLMHRAPFRPFLIEFISGDRILISHPETVMRVANIFAYRSPDRGQRLFDPQSVSQFILPSPNDPNP